ncbi:MAG: Mur ligase family protein [Hyphomicrobiales bacterium]
MTQTKRYFFCGIGGSGMLPLAVIMKALGHDVEGSDRALDQGRTAPKFEYLKSQDIKLHPQDGSGLVSGGQILVASAAVEDTVPDVQSALRLGADQTTRAELLAGLFNASACSIAIGGTSGKSTTTGMIGWILNQAGRNPTILNGAVLSNFVTRDNPFASAVGGDRDLFVSEVDESDGSIAYFTPTISVLNNIAVDHKTLDELRMLFRNFVNAGETAIINLDNDEAAAIAKELPPEKVMTFSLSDTAANVFAYDIEPAPDGVAFMVTEQATGQSWPVRLQVPGRHNVENALAALAAAKASGVPLGVACALIGGFEGIKRRLEVAGSTAGITVIDDFAHNPDKIKATVQTLHEFPGRLLIMFQPHGYGPLRLLKNELIESLASGLDSDDFLLMPEPVYFGGTVERTVTSEDIVSGVTAYGRNAFALADREACGQLILDIARPGDRIVVMGARDDTLSEFAAGLLQELTNR